MGEKGELSGKATKNRAHGCGRGERESFVLFRLIFQVLAKLLKILVDGVDDAGTHGDDGAADHTDCYIS